MDVLLDHLAEKALARARRSALERAKAKAYRHAKAHYPCPNGWNVSWAAICALRERYVLRHYRNQASCSCHMCGNPRRFWKGDDKLPLRQQRVDLGTKEGDAVNATCPL